MHLIGINGFKRSGKGETARIIAEQHPDTVQVGFADKLKVLAAKTLGYSAADDECIALMDKFKEEGGVEWFVGDVFSPDAEGFLNGRQVLQNIGNEARNVFEPNFWINQVLPEPSRHPASDLRHYENRRLLAERYPGAAYVCITDLRYPNEAERVKALGGHVWEVVRPGTESDGHASEIPLPRNLVDLTINNGGDLDDLADEVRAALGTLSC